MMRVIRNLLFFCAGFFGIFYVGLTYAETIPATYVAATSGTGGSQGNDGTGWASPNNCLPYAEACASYDSGGNHFIVRSGYGATCYNSTNYNSFFALPSCTYGAVPAHYECSTGQNWTLSGQNCTRPDCAAGETRGTNGVCQPAYKTCASLVVTSTGSCVKSVPCGSDSSLPLDSALTNAPICADQKTDPTNCAASGGIVIGTFQGKPICLSPPPNDPTCTALGGTVVGTLNGQPVCSNTAGNPPCPGGGTSVGTINGQPVCNGSCGSGSSPGTVNGVTSCYPISPTTTKTTTTKSNSGPATTNTTSTDPNVPATTQQQSTSTTCDGGKCTTTTIINNGPGTPSTTTTKQEDQGDFCAKNPKSSVCTGETEADKYCKDNPDSVACMKAGTPGEEGGLSTVDKSLVSTITPVSIASSGGCPADVQLGKGVYVTYAGICQYAEGLRPIVLVSAWLLAGLIVLGMTKGS